MTHDVDLVGFTKREDNPLPTKPNRGLPGLAWFITIGITVGFTVGWMANESSESKLYCTIFLAFLMYASYKARDHYKLMMECWATYEDMREKLRANRKDKLAKAAPQQVKTVVTENNYAFTSDDFDATAQEMLSKPVKKARKANAKITGQGLIETILKGLK
jgi:hypothetical protein